MAQDLVYINFAEGKIMAFSEEDKVTSFQPATSGIQTSDATPIKIFEISPNENARGFLICYMCANENDGSTGLFGAKIFHWKSSAGSITTLSSNNIVADDLDGLTTATWELDVGDGILRVKVTGEAGKTLNWEAKYLFNQILTTALP